jgi:hypothetical protein
MAKPTGIVSQDIMPVFVLEKKQNVKQGGKK